MYKLIVTLPVNRDFEGILRLEDDKGRLVAGPFAVCGRADREAAGQHGNPSCKALLPFGDTPLGGYRMAGILPTGRRTNLPAERFGPYGVVVLEPTAGEAALADANGRFNIVIQGGKLGRGRRLRPTNGSLRLADKDQKRLIRALRKSRQCVCECVAAAKPLTGRTVACGASYDEADPPFAGSLASLPVMAAASSSRGDDRFSPKGGQTRHFGPPSFNLFADSGAGGGGRGTGGGYGDGSDAERDQEISEATLYLANNALPNYEGAPGKCATFVIDAINQTGIKVAAIGNYDGGRGYAANLGLALEPAGFTDVTKDTPLDKLQPGDIVVVQAYVGQNPPYGHAAMWDGNQWISDYQQGLGRTSPYPWPSSVYANNPPPYAIWRWPRTPPKPKS
jgi:hypothetical protein